MEETLPSTMDTRSLLVLCGSLASAALGLCAGEARAAVCVGGSLDAADPLLQSGRLARDSPAEPSQCASPKAFPGLADAATSFAYDVHHFTNPGATSSCATFTLVWSGANAMFMVAYADAGYDPTDPSAGYLGDPNGSAAPLSMGISIPPGESIDVVVHAIDPGSSAGGAYTLIASGEPFGDSGCFPPTVAVTASPNPSLVGDAVTFTATVAPVDSGLGTPTGQVTFFDGATPLGTAPLSGDQASLTTIALGGGDHLITASYPGDADFAGSTSAPLTQTVQRLTATLDLTSSPNPATVGAAVQLTATVSGAFGVPTGMVTFSDGSTTLGTASLDAAGAAVFTTAALGAGGHTLGATYGGDATYSSAAGAASATVNATTSTTLTLTPNPSVFGQTVRLSATVTSSAVLELGSVTFLDGSSPLGTVALDGAGSASLDVAAFDVGTHAMTAIYGGSPSFAPSTSAAVSQVVTQAGSTTSIAASSNPSNIGTALTFTTTVTAVAPGAGTPTGTVTFSDGGVALGSAPLVGGTATLGTSSLTPGLHAVAVTYAGDTSFAGSSSVTLNQVISQSAATATVAASPSPATYGQDVTFTASVTAPTGGTPTGTVDFKEGSVKLGTGTLDAGGATTFTTAGLAAGTHVIGLTYAGDVNHAGGAGAAVSVAIGARSTITVLATSPRPSSYGQRVTITAAVSPETFGQDAGAGPLAPLPGTVTFVDGGTVIGTAPLSNGVATLTSAVLAVGLHSLTAIFGGAANHAASMSAPLIHRVNAAAPDAGADAGPTDGGQGDTPAADAGGPIDAGAAVDAIHPVDAGAPPDTGVADAAAEPPRPTGSGDGAGCDCRIAGEASPLAWLLASGVALIFWLRRRRSTAPSSSDHRGGSA